MGAETIAILASNVVGWSVAAGVAWNRLSAIEDKQNEIEERQSDLARLVRKQNSRVDKLEMWRERRKGREEGRAEAGDAKTLHR